MRFLYNVVEWQNEQTFDMMGDLGIENEKDKGFDTTFECIQHQYACSVMHVILKTNVT